MGLVPCHTLRAKVLTEFFIGISLHADSRCTKKVFAQRGSCNLPSGAFYEKWFPLLPELRPCETLESSLLYKAKSVKVLY